MVPSSAVLPQTGAGTLWSVLLHSLKKQGDTRLLCSHVSYGLHRCFHLEVQPDIALKTPIRAPWAELYMTVIKHINKDAGFKSTRHRQLVHTCDYVITAHLDF